MQHYFRVIIGGAVICATVACRDTSTPPPVSGPAVAPGQLSAAPRRQVPKRVTPAEFHARNGMDWVGVEHNRLMDELRSDIRHRRPKDLCKAIERLGVETSLDRRASGGLSAADARRVRRAAFEAVGCKGQRFGPRRASASAAALGRVPLVANIARGANDFDMSPAAWAVIDQITSAGGDAPDPGALASELSAIVGGAQGLTADELTVVDAAASVALSSYEYWAQNAEAMAQEMSAAYGDCVANGGGDSCFYAVSDHGVPSSRPMMVQLASNPRSRAACEINRGVIWSGDKWGVGVGLATGLMTRSVQGVVVGIIAGAAIGSGGASAWEFGRYVWCAFHT